jgi:hypothetical protein
MNQLLEITSSETFLRWVTSPIGAIGVGPYNRWWAIVLGCLFAIVALTLLIASWTKWGQQKSLTKCVAIAFLAHVWLLMYAYGTRIFTPGTGGGIHGGPKTNSMQVSIASNDLPYDPFAMETPQTEEATDNDSRDAPSKEFEVKPWETPLPESQVSTPPLDIPPPLAEVKPSVVEDRLPTVVPESRMMEVPVPSVDDAALKQYLASQSVPSKQTDILPGEPVRIAASSPPSMVPLANQPSPRQASTQTQSTTSSYQNRFANNRMEIVRAGGGDESTEASVQLALEWLAAAQASDGGWYAAQHGGGNPSMINRAGPDGEKRQNAGARANTAMTGLALLAFLGAGHHHQSGPYANTVANGLRYLLSQQKASGDLAGHDQNGRDDVVRFARMYSHGMASLALAEAYAITKDPSLQPAVQLASQYTLKAMNGSTGGWRYEYPTNDPGDTSQFGWQAMFLHSAANGGAIAWDPNRKQLMMRFLDSVAAGRDGGLASYRPRSGFGVEAPSVSMTAEAMASRILLGYPARPTAMQEAQRMILTQLPGEREDNFYYWYYATLAMYQMRGTQESELAWQRWNDALKRQLTITQVTQGPQRGSWNPSCIWGPYGGRVYTTALGCLSLEVYYRYLPIYQTQQLANQWQPLENQLR